MAWIRTKREHRRGDTQRHDDAERARVTSAEAAFVAPMLATLTQDRFTDPAWIFERKLDGGRAVAVRNAAGWTDPQRSRTGFGALLVGYYDGARLRYAGKVGTGFDHRTLAELSRRFGDLDAERSPFDDAVREKGAHWLRPRAQTAALGADDESAAGSR